MPGIADRQVLFSQRRFTADASLAPGPAAIVGDTSLVMLSVPQIPRILHARAAGAGAPASGASSACAMNFLSHQFHFFGSDRTALPRPFSDRLLAPRLG